MKTAELYFTAWKSQLRIFLSDYLFHISNKIPAPFFESPNFRSVIKGAITANHQHRSRFQSDETVPVDLSENNYDEKNNSYLLGVIEKGDPAELSKCLHFLKTSLIVAPHSRRAAFVECERTVAMWIVRWKRWRWARSIKQIAGCAAAWVSEANNRWNYFFKLFLRCSLPFAPFSIARAAPARYAEKFNRAANSTKLHPSSLAI